MNVRLVKYLVFGSIFFLLILNFCGLVPGRAPNHIIRVVSYNVENLFDTIDGSNDDQEFLPTGVRHWNGRKYFTKINNLSKVLILCGGWTPPDIIGLCEIENITVLQDLVSKTGLRNVPYECIFGSSPDKRGIGVGLIYNQDKLKVLQTEIWYPIDMRGDTLATRSVLSVILFDRFDTIRYIVTHWPSMRGGVLVSEKNRQMIATLINEKVSSILKEEEGRKIVIMGDFNCSPDSEIISSYLGVSVVENKIDPESLYNLSVKLKCKTGGSYKYQGNWQMLDQVIVTGSLVNPEWGYRTGTSFCRVVSDDVLLIEDSRYKGLKPFSTWSGYRYNRGYSDHLPLVFDLIID